MERLLQAIAAKTVRPNKSVEFRPEHDFTWIDCQSPEEFHWYVNQAVAEGFIPKRIGSGGGTKLWLTVEGWNRAQPLAPLGGTTGHCFVAMSFAADLDDAYNLGIEPAIREDAGYTGGRLKEVEHNDDITDRIMAGIREAQFVVADFTGQRQGVYYEAGFALGLGRPVIWCCREDEVSKLHFDTNHRNHVVWSSPQDLRLKLYNRIQATIIRVQ
jgi:hypothetical protein